MPNCQINWWESKQDWIKVDRDYDLSAGVIDETNSSCEMPSKYFLNILYARGGSKANPQNYVYAARLKSQVETENK